MANQTLQDLRAKHTNTTSSAQTGAVSPLSSLRAKYTAPVAGKKPSSVADTEANAGGESVVESIANPFLKFGSSLLGIVQASGDLGAAGLSKLFGDDKKANEFVKKANEALSKQRDFGVLGKTRAIGIDEKGKQMGAVDYAKDVIGTGAELGSYIVGGGAASGVKAGAKASLGALMKQGAKAGIQVGVVGGGLSSFGSEIRKQEATIGSVLRKTAAGSVIGGAAGGVFGAASEVIFPKIAQVLNKNSLRLAPAQKASLGAKADEAAKFITDQGIIGTPSQRFAKVSTLADNTENKIQNALVNEAKDRFVSKADLLESLKGIPEKYKFDRDALAVERQVEQAMETIMKKFPDQIPLDKLNIFKRSTFHNAYNKAGDKVLDTVEHDIGDAVYEQLAKAADGITIDGSSLRDFNKFYSTLINTKKILKVATGRKQTGALAKLIASFSGSTIGTFIGGPVGGVIGAATAPGILEHGAGTLAKGVFGKGLTNLNKNKVVAPILFNKIFQKKD